ncbi:hypothetical protein [Bacillus wiedmannii]|uniref:hypothetical protein n=1 Tax=Bacillus wiedmannii TaxID=1890302 RepID=UPI000C01319C|nr:hypothetical protein [Bacillus wiedmannii]PFZ91310.1 hypothetical protein COL83_17830 [Bacillus wiedmannii]
MRIITTLWNENNRITVSTIMTLNAGDTVAIRNVGSNTIALLGQQPLAEAQSPTGALRLILLNTL